jgi:hypothetical protein
MCELSVIIPARNEHYLAQTVADVLRNSRADTEVVAVIDGAKCGPDIIADSRVTVIELASAIGQRGATNLGIASSDSAFILKIDAHSSMSCGFDVSLMEACEPDVTVSPMLCTLRVFDWKCRQCGQVSGQGAEPVKCERCDASSSHDKVEKWEASMHPMYCAWMFNPELHFNYWLQFVPQIYCGAKSECYEILSNYGAAWCMRRQRYADLGGLDEHYGMWGHMSSEISLKSWLSGGRVLLSTAAWCAHLFRTTKSFGWPYPPPATRAGRKYLHAVWFNNQWPLQRRPLSWLIDKFAPIPGWDELQYASRLASIVEAGKQFVAQRACPA